MRRRPSAAHPLPLVFGTAHGRALLLRRLTLGGLALLCLCGGDSITHAQPVHPPEVPALVRLAPSMDDAEQARTRRLERRIVELLAGSDGSERMHVQLTLPSSASSPLDAPLPHPRALVVLPEGAHAADDGALTKVVRSTLADDRAEVLVLRPPRPRAVERLVSIGPFRVAGRSAGPLRMTLAVMFITNALLALAVLAQSWRHRPTEPKVDRRGRSRT